MYFETDHRRPHSSCASFHATLTDSMKGCTRSEHRGFGLCEKSLQSIAAFAVRCKHAVRILTAVVGQDDNHLVLQHEGNVMGLLHRHVLRKHDLQLNLYSQPGFSRLQSAGYSQQATVSRLHSAGYSQQASVSRLLSAGFSQQASVSRLQSAGFSQQATVSRF